MLILVGPSASGKTEIASLLIDKYKMERMITYTTRPIRVGEVNHVSYHFVSELEFKERIQNDEFIEFTTYNGYYYGSNKKDAGVNKIVILEPNGVNAFYEKMKEDVTIIYISANDALRVDRMYRRGDSHEQVQKRIKNDQLVFGIDKLSHIDKVFVNENISLNDITKEIYEYYKNIWEENK